MTINTYHIPVMLQECIQGLNIQPEGTYVDITFGGGGHSKEILKHLNDKGKLIVFDQDKDAINNIPNDHRVTFVNHNFKFCYHFLTYLNAIPVDGILGDLGISSHQINTAEKGFAHRLEGDIDMRMDKQSKLSAATILNEYNEKQLLYIFNQYGEIKNAYKLVQSILSYRKNNKINTVQEFKQAIKDCIPKLEESKYLSQVFQALRIEVNNEIKALETLLSDCYNMLKKDGRLVIMSYHSLEDRLVKNLIQSGNINGEIEKDFFGKITPYYKNLTKKPIIPSESEIIINKRARSAKLRIAAKI